MLPIPNPVLDIHHSDVFAQWARQEGLSVDSVVTDCGRAVVVNGELALISSPSSTSSQQLRSLQQEWKAQGRALYFIYPWEERSFLLLNHFKSKLGLDARKFAAKRLRLEVIDNKTGNNFMKDYHIQGSAAGVDKISFALITKDTEEILAVQQFSRYRWGSSNKSKISESRIWEGLRLCFKPGVQIYGGASRLQRAFEKETNPEKIISYINLSHSDGSYKSHQGFTMEVPDKQLSFMWVLRGKPKSIVVVDKNGKRRKPDLDKVRNTPYLNPNKIAGGFGKGIGMTFFGGKLGSRKELKEKENVYFHNDMILEAIGYERVWTAGQGKWIREPS
jgi:hypothetical protein